MSQLFLLRKETPWHDCIINSWPTHPYSPPFCVSFCVGATYSDGETIKTHIQHWPSHILDSPINTGLSIFAWWDNLAIRLPWCEMEMMRSLPHSWSQMNPDLTPTELSNTSLTIVFKELHGTSSPSVYCTCQPPVILTSQFSQIKAFSTSLHCSSCLMP